MQAPTMLYRSEAGTLKTKVVDRCDVERMHADGWRESPGEAEVVIEPCEDTIYRLRAHAEALGMRIVEVVTTPGIRPEILPPTLEDLRAQAEAKGIKVDGRWSAARLQAEIEKAT